jgi:hypothetical protein
MLPLPHTPRWLVMLSRYVMLLLVNNIKEDGIFKLLVHCPAWQLISIFFYDVVFL